MKNLSVMYVSQFYSSKFRRLGRSVFHHGLTRSKCGIGFSHCNYIYTCMVSV